MQPTLINPDISQKRVFVPISGGINSAGLLCYLATDYYPRDFVPKEIFMFYCHLKEHSPGTIKFVRLLVAYAKNHFERVTFEFSVASVIEFFKKQNMIPHPMFSPCSEQLKMIPMSQFADRHAIDLDLIGYVKTEKSRMNRQLAKGIQGKGYPIIHLTDEDCFALVRREIGYYPPIYDILDGNGKRVFKHNNCLPCKNMQGKLSAKGTTTGDFEAVRKYYPGNYRQAIELSQELGGAYWGREPKFEGYCRTCED